VVEKITKHTDTCLNNRTPLVAIIGFPNMLFII